MVMNLIQPTRWPTCRPTCRPTVGQQSVNCRSTVGQLSADAFADVFCKDKYHALVMCRCRVGAVLALNHTFLSQFKTYLLSC